MAFRTNEFQTISLDDEFNRLSERTKKIVVNSWAKDFADIVFPAINESRFSVLYSDNKASRSNTPVNIIVGALMIKSMFGQSDDDLMESICCDVRYKYALHTTSYEEQPVSDRTFSRFRERLYNYQVQTGEDLLDEEMKHLSSVYAKFMNLHSNIKRMDSMMIASSAKRMSRLEIIYAVNSNAVALMHQLGADDLIPDGLEHYLSADDRNDVIYYCKEDDVASRLAIAIKEAELIKQAMEPDEWHEFSQYRLLIRVINEQSKYDEDGNIEPKDNSEITSSSLQNPSDPDATYRKKAGKDNKGYSANFVETIGDDGNSLITDFDFQPNTYSDSQFCKDQILKHSGEDTVTIIADGAYGGIENQELAAENNVVLVTTALNGKPVDEIYSEFEYNEDGTKVLKCPAGYAPNSSTYYESNGTCRITMAKSCCGNCPYKDRCKAKEQRNNYVLTTSSKMTARAKYMKALKTEDYIKLTRMRNAVEGIPSIMRRKYHVDRSPFKGLIRTGWTFSLGVGAYNIQKLIKYRSKTRGKSTLQPILG